MLKFRLEERAKSPYWLIILSPFIADNGWANGLAAAPQTRIRLAKAVYDQPQAPVAQLDRALPSEGRGQRFESSRVRHNSLNIFR